MSIACPISQLRRVLNLCSCHLPSYVLLGPYLGSESRSANRLPDFSAASCTEPLLLPSICPPHTQAIPSRALYVRDSVLFAWTLPIACPISQLHHALNFELSSMANPYFFFKSCSSKLSSRYFELTYIILWYTGVSLSHPFRLQPHLHPAHLRYVATFRHFFNKFSPLLPLCRQHYSCVWCRHLPNNQCLPPP